MLGYVIDAVLILAAALLIWNGYRKGVLKTAVRLGFFAGAVVLAKLLTDKLTPLLAKVLPMPGIGTKLASYLNINVEKIGDGQLAELLTSWGFSQKAADAIQGFFERTASSASESLTRQLTPAFDTLLTAAIVFVFLLIVLFLIALLLSNVFDNALELPVLSALNRITGIAAGLAAAALVICVAQLVISWIFPLIDASLDFSLTKMADRSIILKTVGKINPIEGILSGYLE